jgi:hypothetical protein
MDENIVNLSDYRGKGGGDLRSVMVLYAEIAKIENIELREFFQDAWREGAKIASLLYPVS